ncbi:TPM domain-containing protein [Burkholderia ubonensis]|uniref:TPM domain-containing protein n=1 Tax=Burkholderia ubonensis TaxID=101571 RepID=UPI00358E880F
MRALVVGVVRIAHRADVGERHDRALLACACVRLRPRQQAGAIMKKMSARERAIDVFSALRIWDTEHNNGILIYVLLADRAVEIVADRGIHAKVESGEWEAICHVMEAAFKRRAYESGTLRGIDQVTELLKKHFPVHRPPCDELPSSPVVM